MIRMRSLILSALLLCTATMAKGQLLWEVSGNSAKSKSYIFGTDRLADISFLDTVPNLFKVYGRCSRVITEMAINDMDAARALREAALLPDSASLRGQYTQEEYSRIDAAIQLAINMDLDKVGRMKPSYLTELYRNELLRRWMGYDEDRSMENFFQTVAKQQGKPVIALDDTGEAIYMAFDREPTYWQCKELLKIVDYPEREIQLEKALLNLYRNGQLLEMTYRVTAPDNLSTLSYSDYQVYARRNLNWTKRLIPYLTEGDNFICLNALYLGGDDGLLARLKAAGYKIRPVNRFKLLKDKEFPAIPEMAGETAP